MTLTRASLLGVLLFLFAGEAKAADPLKTAVWVVRDRLATPTGVEETCREARAAGFDTLVAQVRGRGDAYYASTLVPRAESLAGAPRDFDPLRELVAGAAGMRVLAWLNAFYVWGKDTPPQDPSHILRAHPEWLMRDEEGRPLSEHSAFERSLGWLEGAYADPASVEYRGSFCDVVREVVSKYPVDGIHLDFIRYPGSGYGHATSLDREFEARWGFDPRWIPADLRAPDLASWISGTMPLAQRVLATASLLWAELRAEQVTALVRAVRATIDSVRPGLELSAAVFPDAREAYLGKGQDWPAWASEGLVDALFPMAYFGSAERTEAQLRAIRDLVRPSAPNVRLWAGLGAYLKGPEGIEAEAAAAGRLGFDGVCLFDLGSALRRPGGLTAYARAARGVRGESAVQPANTPRLPGDDSGGLGALTRIARKVLPEELRAAPALEAKIRARWSEFEQARGSAISAAVTRVRGAPLRVPPWVELRGLFRYVHPLDTPERKAAQRQATEEARAKVLAGEPWDAVVRERSQGGTKTFGGGLGRRYLRAGSGADDLLAAMAPGQVTPVVEESSGFWLYVVDRKGGGDAVGYEAAPWAVRREAFRRELDRACGDAPSTAIEPASLRRTGAPEG